VISFPARVAKERIQPVIGPPERPSSFSRNNKSARTFGALNGIESSSERSMSLYAPREVVIEARQNRKRDTHPVKSGSAGGVRATVTTPEQAQTMAQQAYVYGYPMVQAYLTMYAFSINKEKSPI